MCKMVESRRMKGWFRKNKTGEIRLKKKVKRLAGALMGVEML